MLGIMLIDMQEKYFISEKERLVLTQKKLLEYAEKKKLPVFILEYIGEGKTIPQLQDPLKKTNSYFIKKYNDNAFIKLTDAYLKTNLKNVSEECILFGDEWNENAPENETLKKLLNKNKIKYLILTGVNKTGCVFKTAKGAKKRGYKIFTSDELMNEKDRDDFQWYKNNSNHYNTLEELIKKIETLNIN